MNFPVERKNERDRVLGDGFRRIGRDPRNPDPQLSRGFQIHMIKAGTAKRDQPDPILREQLKYAAVELIVHKRTNCFMPAGERRGIAVEANFQECESMRRTGGLVRLGEEVAIIHP